eukprot:2116689-Rhodomonas_salina.1
MSNVVESQSAAISTVGSALVVSFSCCLSSGMLTTRRCSAPLLSTGTGTGSRGRKESNMPVSSAGGCGG